jgi:hypothetical protein
METLLGILIALLSFFGLGPLGAEIAPRIAESVPAAGFAPAPVEDRAPSTQFIMIEHADNVTNHDLGETGPTPGDMIVWGPDPLYDEFDISDTGATTQGACTAVNSAGDCLLVETIVFPDGSTLEIQGVQPGVVETSTRTIVGGSGQYLGATGTVTVEPSADRLLWTKTFEIWM